MRSRAAHHANGARAGRVEVVEVEADLDEPTSGIDAQGDGDEASAPEPPSCDENTRTPRSAHRPHTLAARADARHAGDGEHAPYIAPMSMFKAPRSISASRRF